jgi:hypothetical protein
MEVEWDFDGAAFFTVDSVESLPSHSSSESLETPRMRKNFPDSWIFDVFQSYVFFIKTFYRISCRPSYAWSIGCFVNDRSSSRHLTLIQYKIQYKIGQNLIIFWVGNHYMHPYSIMYQHGGGISFGAITSTRPPPPPLATSLSATTSSPDITDSVDGPTIRTTFPESWIWDSFESEDKTHGYIDFN